MDIIEFLRKNKYILSINAIESELQLPKSSLLKAVAGTQSLSEKHKPAIENFLKNRFKDLF
jgi:hypothetical protein